MKTIYTIGYSSFKIDEFISTLKKYHINSLIDVRSNPNSKFYSDYNRNNLELLLKHHRIIYRNYKVEFGARQEDPQYHTKGYLDFEKFVKSKIFIEGFKKIEAGIEKNYTFAFMCAEKDPSTCHRNIMVAREFYKKGYPIANILSDGLLESQQDLEKRMVNHYFPDRKQLTLFTKELTWDEMVDKSYTMRNSEIGYVTNGGEAEDEYTVYRRVY